MGAREPLHNTLRLAKRATVKTLESETAMLRSTKDLKALAIVATDGVAGHVSDLCFSDATWMIRHLIVDVGTGRASRKVLVSPFTAGKPDWAGKHLPVALTRAQVKSSPDTDSSMPVHGQKMAQHGEGANPLWPWGGIGMWGNTGLWGMFMMGADVWGRGGCQELDLHSQPGSESGKPSAQSAAKTTASCTKAQAGSTSQKVQTRPHEPDPHLRCWDAVTGYRVATKDGEIGRLQGLLIDEENWAIRYLVVRTSKWWPGHDVLVAPHWIESTHWDDKTICTKLALEAIQQAPHYNSAMPVARKMEIALHQHYGYKGYWPGATAATNTSKPATPVHA